MASYTNYDEQLNSIHDTGISDNPEETGYIQITEKRQFTPSTNFDTTVAYEGDINSQIITFNIFPTFDGHSLYGCGNKKIKCKNLSSGVEGLFDIEPAGTAEKFDVYEWHIPPEMCTQSGELEVSLHFYDIDEGGKVVYSWNTATWQGLSIGKSNNNVSGFFPARDEILIVDRETKNIVAPVGYNNVICNYGEIGIGCVYLLINRYLDRKRELDALNGDLTIHVVFNGYKYVVDAETVSKALYTEEIGNNKDSLVLITWEVEKGLTAENLGSGSIKIAIKCSHNGKTWVSNEYSGLRIDASVALIDLPDGPTISEDELNAIVRQMVGPCVDEYLSSNEFIIEPDREIFEEDNEEDEE